MKYLAALAVLAVLSVGTVDAKKKKQRKCATSAGSKIDLKCEKIKWLSDRHFRISKKVDFTTYHKFVVAGVKNSYNSNHLSQSNVGVKFLCFWFFHFLFKFRTRLLPWFISKLKISKNRNYGDRVLLKRAPLQVAASVHQKNHLKPAPRKQSTSSSFSTGPVPSARKMVSSANKAKQLYLHFQNTCCLNGHHFF